MSNHTPEPWNGKRIGIAVHYFESINTEIALTGKSDETMANARRIVACVMACRGLSTDELEQHGLVSAVGAELMKLEKQQRDAGKAAILACADHFREAWEHGFIDRPEQDMLDVTTAIRNFAETYQGAGS